MNGVSTLWVLTALAGLIGVLIVWLQRHPEEMRRLMKIFGEKGLMNAQYDPHTPTLWRRFFSLPQTSLGWLSVVLIAVPMGLFFFGIDLIQMVSPWVIVCGPASIIIGLIAVIWRHERSALVWLAMVVGLVPTPFAIQWLLYVTNSPWYSP